MQFLKITQLILEVYLIYIGLLNCSKSEKCVTQNMAQLYFYILFLFLYSSLITTLTVSNKTKIFVRVVNSTNKTIIYPKSNRTICTCQNKTQLNNRSLPEIEKITSFFSIFFLQFLKFYILIIPMILFTTALYISRLFTKPTSKSPYSTTSTTVELSITQNWKFNKFMLQTSSCACFLLSNLVFMIKEFTTDVVFDLTKVELKLFWFLINYFYKFNEQTKFNKQLTDCLTEVFNDYVCHLPGHLFIILLSVHYCLSLSKSCIFVRVPFKVYGCTALIIPLAIKALFILKGLVSGTWREVKFGENHL